MAPITPKKRKQLPKKQFASPKGVGDKPQEDQYPMDTPARAQSAISYVQKNGSEAEQKRVIGAVCKKYPDMPMCKKIKNAPMNQLIRKAVRGPQTVAEVASKSGSGS